MIDYKTEAKKCYEKADYDGYVDLLEKQYCKTNSEEDLHELEKSRNILQLYKEIQDILKMNEKDSYKILGIDQKATVSEIKKVFREKASRYHPNRAPVKGSHDAFRIIQEAYFKINTEEKKKEYDYELKNKQHRFQSFRPETHFRTYSQPQNMAFSFGNGSFAFTNGSFAFTTTEFYPFQMMGSDLRNLYSVLYRNNNRNRREGESMYITGFLIILFIILNIIL